MLRVTRWERKPRRGCRIEPLSSLCPPIIASPGMFAPTIRATASNRPAAYACLAVSTCRLGSSALATAPQSAPETKQKHSSTARGAHHRVSNLRGRSCQRQQGTDTESVPCRSTFSEFTQTTSPEVVRWCSWFSW